MDACPVCGTRLTEPLRGPLPTACSYKCRRVLRLRRMRAEGLLRRECEICSTPFDSLTAQFCSQACRNEAASASRRVVHGASEYRRGCRCEVCREGNRLRMRAYYRSKGGNKHRKPEHVKPGWRRRYPESARSVDQRRRARKLGAAVEKFTSVEIFERDGWVCGICGEPVDSGLRYPDPLSSSLDHIKPLSLGGDHSRANTRCSHLTCNVKRGNRVAA